MLEKVRSVLAILSITVLVLSGCSNSTKSVSSSKSFLWVATPSDQLLKSYTIDWTSGSVAAASGANAGISTGNQPSAIAASNDRLTLFVANAGDNTIGIYSVKTDGTLVSAGPPVNGGASPKAMLVDPTGNLLFVADQGSDTILVFAITPGLLTVKASFPIVIPAVPGGSGPVALAITPASFPCNDTRTLIPTVQSCYGLYAANQTANTVSAHVYFVDGSGNFVRGSVDLAGNFVVGGLVSGSPYPVGTGPTGLAFSRCAGVTSSSTNRPCAVADKNNLFVSNAGSNDVTIFTACLQLGTCQNGEVGPDGTLTVAVASVPAGAGRSAVLVDPIADFVYVVNSGANQVSEFAYNPTVGSGSLSLLGTAPFSGTAVISGGITPNIPNLKNTWVVLTGDTGIATYAVGSSGALSATSSGQVSLSQPSAILIR